MSHGPSTLSRRHLLLGSAAGLALAGLADPSARQASAAGVAYVTVRASVANLWRSPSSPRAIDAASLRPEPDVRGWLRRLDAQGKAGRLGLLGRLDSQLLRYEPVVVLRRRSDGWTQVAAPWHPTSGDRRGYVGWVAPGQISSTPWRGARRGGVPVVTRGRTATTFLAAARRYTGLPYLWAGTSPLGVDCSGLVLAAARQVGVQVPRDADDQLDAARRVSLARVRPGDLYFFAQPGKRPHHVGIVTRPGYMLNSPQTGARVREERVTGARARTLVAAGRFPGLS